MKREATSSPDDGQKKEKRKYVRKPKPPASEAAPAAEAPASSLMDVVWGASDGPNVKSERVDGPKMNSEGQAARADGPKSNSDAPKKKKTPAKKGKQAGEGEATRDGGANGGGEGVKTAAGPSQLGNRQQSLRVEDESEEEEDEANFGFGRENFRREDPERMQQIFATMTEEQMRRYECFRRSGLSRPNLKRLMQNITGTPVTIPMTIVMAGLSKMFVGDLIETAREVMTEWNESGPIRPTHIREALRRLKQGGKVPVRSRPLLFA